MICKKCGNEIADGQRYCQYCGQDQNADVAKEESFADTAKELGSKAIDTAKDMSNKAKDIYIKSDKFFANVGDKLCKVAKIVFWIGAIASAIAFLIMLIGAFRWIRWSFGQFLLTALYAVLILAAGILASWLGSLGMYGFGELIRRVQALEERSR